MNKEYFNSSRNIITIYQALKTDEIVISQKVATFEMIVNFLDTSTSLLNANKRIFDLLNFKDISKTKNLELTASLQRIAKVIEEEEKRLSKIIKQLDNFDNINKKKELELSLKSNSFFFSYKNKVLLVIIRLLFINCFVFIN